MPQLDQELFFLVLFFLLFSFLFVYSTPFIDRIFFVIKARKYIYNLYSETKTYNTHEKYKLVTKIVKNIFFKN